MKRPQLLLSSCIALALVAVMGSSRTASAAGVITDTIAPTTDLILPFGAVAVGKSSPVQTITITNTDLVNEITVPRLQLSPPFILNLNGGSTPCGTGKILSPFASCTFTVTFQPDATGSHTALLTIISDISGVVGERIAFHDLGTRGISLFDVESNKKIAELTLPPADTEDLNPSWSPGQGQIVFHRHNITTDSNTLLRVNIDGTGETTFVANNGKTPSWSPDGRRIAYSDSTPNVEIKLVDLNLNLLNQFGNVGTGGIRRDPKWSPLIGKNELAYSLTSNDGRGIFKINADGTSNNSITISGGKTPSWSPNGQNIAFQDIPKGAFKGGISTVNSEGGIILPLTPSTSGVNDKNPSWSTNGSQIVIHRATETPPMDELIVINSDNGSNPSILTSGKTPAWSPSNKVSISFLGTGLSQNTNSPPTAPQLISPTVNQKNVTVPVTFKWLSSSDPDGDPITYDLLVCPSAVFPKGACVLEENVGVESSQKPMTSAGIWLSGGSLLFGIAFSGRRRLRHQTTRRSIWSSFFLLTIMVIILNACGGGGGGNNPTITPGGGGSGTTGVELTHTVDNLAAGTSFTWQVTAKDDKGGATPSVARSFKTAPLAS